MRAALLAAAACLFPPGRAISEAPTPGAPRAAFQVDAKTSRLTVETETVGLASMFGHDHRFLARDFTGTIALARPHQSDRRRLGRGRRTQRAIEQQAVERLDAPRAGARTKHLLAAPILRRTRHQHDQPIPHARTLRRGRSEVQRQKV